VILLRDGRPIFPRASGWRPRRRAPGC